MQTWIEINCAALRHNFRQIQALVGDRVALFANVKANAYGCGAVECARIFAGEGAPLLCVTRLDEALELRAGGLETAILLLAPLLPDEFESALRNKLTLSISSFDEAKALSALAEAIGETARVHLKINTGMNRFGAQPSKTAEIVGRSSALPALHIEGAFTHFSRALEADPAPTQQQFEAFQDATFGLKGRVATLIFHTANSSALVRFPAMRLDAVRPGTLLYGQFPASPARTPELQLENPFTAKARVVALQNVAPGHAVGYGAEWRATKPSKIAILACGWADGLTLEPQARAVSPLGAVRDGFKRAVRLQKTPNAGREATIRGHRATFVGRIAMQTSALDVSDVSGVQIGDECEIPMRRLSANPLLKRIYLEK